jgi:hypothetical protein
MHFAGNVTWSLSAPTNLGCSTTADPQVLKCGNIFDVTAPSGSVTPTGLAGRIQFTTPKLDTNDVGKQGVFQATVTPAVGADCTWEYLIRVTNSGGGWGDPHLTTVDGVHYDFQSAGEFTGLREEQFELQTRQTAVPTASIPGANPYTGLASCVSIYTAVATRIGKNRVTLQPAGGEPNPNTGIQLRVNGQLVTLTERGIDLAGEQSGILAGRITGAAGGAYQVTDARGTQGVVPPAFWDSQQKWYLNGNVYHTTATAGVMGRLALRSWLPALPDGTSLGPMPESLTERYQQLYEQFADAWRVTDATSLFDYAPGTNTATFTLDEWPRSTPKSCALEGQTSATPVTPEVAAEACKGVTDAAQRADCVFDVTFTGHTGFGQSYQAMQSIPPNPNGWQPPLVVATQVPPPVPSGWPWWVWLLILILILILIFVLFLRKKTA